MSIDDFEGIYIAFTEGVNELIDGNVDAMVAMAATTGCSYGISS